MSDLHETIFTCPHCGHQFNINVYDAVNVTKDPDLRDAVVSGDIFVRIARKIIRSRMTCCMSIWKEDS